MSNKPILVVDVSPLFESQYTGISNVVYELAKRFLFSTTCRFEIIFSAFWKQVDKSIIQKCILERNGQCLQEAINQNHGIIEIITDSKGNIDGRKTFGLYLHRKPNQRVFLKDSYLFYDFSFLLAPECHTKETVQFHSEGLFEQVNTTELFFCISESTAKDLEWIFNIQKNKILISPLGSNVDADLADRMRSKIADRVIEPYFMTLGTIEPRKNIGIILAWISKNKKILLKYRFVFAGRQGWGKPFQEYITEYGLDHEFDSGRIVYHGYINEAQKTMLLIGAKAVFYPSLFEGFGLPILEAMELGIPVIASCSTSIPEVLGDTGYYFDPYSLDSFDNAVKNFIHDDLTGKIDILRNAAKNKAQTFSYDKTFSIIHNALISYFMMQPIEMNKTYNHKSDHLEFHGFSEPENDFRWSDCKHAYIGFNWDNNIVLSEELHFVFNTFRLQHITLKLNDHKIYSNIIDTQSYTIKLPIGEFLLKGKNILGFDLPNATQPDENDTRILAVAFRELKITIGDASIEYANKEEATDVTYKYKAALTAPKVSKNKKNKKKR